MSEGEDAAMSRVVESLCAALPQVPEPSIRECVHQIRAEFSNARIRTYLPILVDRRARARLSGWSAVGGVGELHADEPRWTTEPLAVSVGD
jgi:hypothetical protein